MQHRHMAGWPANRPAGRPQMRNESEIRNLCVVRRSEGKTAVVAAAANPIATKHTTNEEWQRGDVGRPLGAGGRANKKANAITRCVSMREKKRRTSSVVGGVEDFRCFTFFINYYQ